MYVEYVFHLKKQKERSQNKVQKRLFTDIHIIIICNWVKCCFNYFFALPESIHSVTQNFINSPFLLCKCLKTISHENTKRFPIMS